jgi:glyoxylase-like metal-dependent hydrolase (beta-lactamase superfamily II)
MTYTGEVSPGGPSDVRELPDLIIRKASVSAQDNNSYLITCRLTGQQMLIDAADSAPRLTALLAESGQDGAARLETVVTTHQHWDHHRALAEVVAATGARTAAGREDAGELPVGVDIELENGDRLAVGRLSLEVVHLRGHTPGSVALVLTSSDGSVHAFTGDSLFPGGPGRTTTPETFSSLMDDLEARIFGPLPDDTWIYPGHGKDSTLGTERPQLPQWRARGW